MNTQDTNNTVSVSFVDSFQSYAADSKRLGELKTRLEDTRKILEPVIRAHKIPVGDNKAWKALQPEFNKVFLAMEWPMVDGEMVDAKTLSETAIKQIKSRVAAWLGVLRTCLEYQILPTDKNADRLRKAKVWVGLNGNGKMNPNWVDPNAPKVEPTPATAPTATAPTATAPTATAPTATAPTATAPTATAPTPSKAVSVSATTPQKTAEVIHPISSNVSSADAPISAREHFKVLFNQMLKNETFREEYCGILALMLDVEKSTLTRCMVQAADEVKV